jgi:hypothetical protein
MRRHSTFRRPILLCLVVFCTLLFSVTAYLVFLTIYEHAKLDDNIEHSCALIGSPASIYTDTQGGNVVVVSDYEVEIVSSDPLYADSGRCDIQSACTKYHYTYSSVYCDQYVLPTGPVTCWTTTSSNKPVCEEPGSAWQAAMVGAIVTASIALGMLICVLCLKKDIRKRASMSDDGIETFVAVPIVIQPQYTSRPVPLVQGTVVSDPPKQPANDSPTERNAKPYVI